MRIRDWSSDVCSSERNIIFASTVPTPQHAPPAKASSDPVIEPSPPPGAMMATKPKAASPNAHRWRWVGLSPRNIQANSTTQNEIYREWRRGRSGDGQYGMVGRLNIKKKKSKIQ